MSVKDRVGNSQSIRSVGIGGFSYLMGVNPQNNREHVAAHIESGTNVSDLINLDDAPRGIAVVVPSAWTAADITFEVSIDETNWYPVRDKTGVLVRITGILTAADSVYQAPAEAWLIGAFKYMRLVSSTVGLETAANQGADRELVVVLLG